MTLRRRGTIYIITLGMTMIVAALATAGLLAVRAQRNRSELFQQMVQARLNAQSSLEWSLLQIEQTDTWRSDLTIVKDTAELSVAGETAVVTGVDPVDGDVSDSDLDPLVLTATGVSGPATQKIEVRLEPRWPGLRCLEPVVHSNTRVALDAATLAGNRLLSSNGDILARNGSAVYVGAEAAKGVTASGGSVFHAGTTTAGDWPREMPDEATVLDYYLTHGTPIEFTDLPLWGGEQLVNPHIISGQMAWEGHGCMMILDGESSQTPWALRLYERESAVAGARQDVTRVLQSGETYEVRADVKVVTGAMEMRIDIWAQTEAEGYQCFYTEWTPVDDTSFGTLFGVVQPVWTGPLEKASFLVRSRYGTENFKLDDASLRIANTTPDCRIVHRQVLSPNSNPYGSGVTNTQGIYLIDCGGKPLVVKDCRIAGTLVLLNQDEEKSRLQGSINWEPAAVSGDPDVTNLPILLSNMDLHFDTMATDLIEATVNANFNPPGVPHPGSGDNDLDDVYPSIFKGIVYTKRSLHAESDLRVHGALVSQGEMIFTNATVRATFDPVYYWYNAPPGFRAELLMEIVPGSFRRVVD